MLTFLLLCIISHVLGLCSEKTVGEGLCAKVYKNDNCDGEQLEIASNTKKEDLGDWRNTISSLVVKDGCKLRVFQKKYFDGDKKNFQGDVEQLNTVTRGNDNTKTWNDKISSYKCTCEE